MRTYNKEVVYIIRSPEGTITDVYDIETKTYLKVVDIAIRIDPSESSEPVVDGRFAKLSHKEVI